MMPSWQTKKPEKAVSQTGTKSTAGRPCATIQTCVPDLFPGRGKHTAARRWMTPDSMQGNIFEYVRVKDFLHTPFGETLPVLPRCTGVEPQNWGLNYLSVVEEISRDIAEILHLASSQKRETLTWLRCARLLACVVVRWCSLGRRTSAGSRTAVSLFMC